MMILCGGGGSTNITYVPASAATDNPMILIQSRVCLPGRRALLLDAPDPGEEYMTRSRGYRRFHGRPGGRSRGAMPVRQKAIPCQRPRMNRDVRSCKITDLHVRRDQSIWLAVTVPVEREAGSAWPLIRQVLSDANRSAGQCDQTCHVTGRHVKLDRVSGVRLGDGVAQRAAPASLLWPIISMGITTTGDRLR